MNQVLKNNSDKNISTDIVVQKLPQDEIAKENIKKREKKYARYSASLRPISIDEFVKEIKILHKRYQDFLKYRQDENILFCSLDLDFPKIIRQAQMATNGFELAEILDKAKNRMNDLEGIKDIVSNTNKIILQEIKNIKQIEK